jgi:hypothetical protein
MMFPATYQLSSIVTSNSRRIKRDDGISFLSSFEQSFSPRLAPVIGGVSMSSHQSTLTTFFSTLHSSSRAFLPAISKVDHFLPAISYVSPLFPPKRTVRRRKMKSRLSSPTPRSCTNKKAVCAPRTAARNMN